jgi:hypothetical protein
MITVLEFTTKTTPSILTSDRKNLPVSIQVLIQLDPSSPTCPRHQLTSTSNPTTILLNLSHPRR